MAETPAPKQSLEKQPAIPPTEKGKGKGKGKPSKALQGIPDSTPLLEDPSNTSRRKRQTPSGNPLLTVVDTTGICEMEILPCLCPNRLLRHEQLLQAGLFCSTFDNPETAFTFMVLDDYLIENLECKTTGQQYFSKLQIITNKVFPHSVPVCSITFHICAYAHTYYRICTDSF
jgi:hypothetical protein